MEFEKKVLLRTRNRFAVGQPIADIVKFVREQKIAGELTIVFPGNGGIAAVDFVEKQRVIDAENNGVDSTKDS